MLPTLIPDARHIPCQTLEERSGCGLEDIRRPVIDSRGCREGRLYEYHSVIEVEMLLRRSIIYVHAGCSERIDPFRRIGLPLDFDRPLSVRICSEKVSDDLWM